MPIDDYYQDYGPMKRRRALGELDNPRDFGELPRAPRPRRRTRRRRSPLGALLLLLLVLLLTPLVFVYALPFFLRGGALPGVTVQGMSVSGLDAAAISATLRARHDEFLRTPLTITLGDQRWQPTSDEIGVRLDIERTAREAVAIGRSGDPLSRMQRLWSLYTGGYELAPYLTVDQRALQQYLLNIAGPLEQAPRDAALSITAAKVVGTPAVPGLQVLADATANDALLALHSLQPQEIPLRTRRLEPTIDDSALLAAEQRARDLLQSPLALQRGEDIWLWDAEKIAELLMIRSEGRELLIDVNTEQLLRAVERLAQEVDSGTAEPRLAFNGGALQIVQEGQSGWQLRQEEAVDAISATLQLSQPLTRTLGLPVDVLQPQVTAANLGELGITQLVGEGLSSFAGSAAYRITNIKAGARRMDGVLIAPGEEFSFNTQLGAVDAENGFVEGYAIIGNRTQLEWGGGVCQDSTTVFRAAFWAGLPITERHAHAFYISWYDRFGLGPNGDGQGLDAAIYTGVNDLRFYNDTGNWLLMQATVDEMAQVLAVRLYGTKPNREVRLEGPIIDKQVPAPSEPVYVDDPSRPRGSVYQSDVARSGRDITVYRVIYQDGVEISREAFVTRFKAWPNVFVRGTG
jgi:vancomycin resistance protein YoaR